jgi:hypothetical protein
MSGRIPRFYQFALIVIGLLLVVGCIVPVCKIEVQGVVGWFLQFLEQDDDGNKFEFSLLSLGWRLREVTSDAHRVEAVLMQVLYFLTAICMNMCFIIPAIAFATMKLGDSVVKKLGKVLPIFRFWSGADIYALGTWLIVYEMNAHDFGVTMGMEDLIEKQLRPHIMLPGVSNDFVTFAPTMGRHAPGVWILLAAAISMHWVGYKVIYKYLIPNKEFENEPDRKEFLSESLPNEATDATMTDGTSGTSSQDESE